MNQLIMQAAQQYRPRIAQKFVEYVKNEPMAAAQLRAPLFEDKVVDFLFSKAQISEREVSREALQAAIECRGRPCPRPGLRPRPRPRPQAKAQEGRRQEGQGRKAEKAEAAAEKPAKKAKAKAEAAPKPAKKAAAAKAEEGRCRRPPRSRRRRNPLRRPELCPPRRSMKSPPEGEGVSSGKDTGKTKPRILRASHRRPAALLQ